MPFGLRIGGAKHWMSGALRPEGEERRGEGLAFQMNARGKS